MFVKLKIPVEGRVSCTKYRWQRKNGKGGLHLLLLLHRSSESVCWWQIMFLGIDNCFVTSCHEDLVLDTGLVSAVAL